MLLALYAPAAKAQYGYSPLTGSSNWLWLSRSLFGGGSNLFRGGSYGYTTPYYLANTLGWNATYAASQGINMAGRNAAMKKFYANPGNGINGPVNDQISVAPWYSPPRGVPGNTPSPSVGVDAINNTDPFADPKNTAFMPVPAAIPDSSPSAGPIANPLSSNPVPGSTIQNEAPGTAPDFRTSQASAPGSAPSRHKSNKSDSHKSKSQAKSSGSNPFAQAFIDHVNDNFSGDISRALSDNETRGYAAAIGLLDSNKSRDFDLPPERIDLIRRILKDPEEDSLTKVNTIRILIKH